LGAEDAAHRLWRLAGCAEKGTAHPLALVKAGIGGDFVQRVIARFHASCGRCALTWKLHQRRVGSRSVWMEKPSEDRTSPPDVK
jgi:hypothetical protein